MHRRLNTRLLLWTLAGATLVAGAVVAVHELQVRRNVEVLLRRADRAYADNQPHQAVRYLEQYLAYEPHDTDALVRYATTLHKIADSPGAQYRALLVLEQAVRRCPNDPALRREAAQLALEMFHYGEAAEHFQALVQLEPQNAQAWQDLGWCQQGIGQTEAAEASYRKSIALDPHLLQSYARLASMLLLLDRSEETHIVLEEMIRANPTSVDALLARADYLQQTGGAAQAAKDVDQAFAAAPNDLRAILAKAELAQKNLNFALARGVLTGGLEHHPANAALHQALVRLELKAGRQAEAAQWLEREIKELPQDVALRWQMLELALAMGDRKRAEHTLGELKRVEGEAGYVWRHGQAALLLTFSGPRDAAALQLARQRINEVKQKQPDWNQPLLLEGFLEEAAGHNELALQHYERAQKLGPVSPPFLFRLASLLYAKRDFTGAAAALDQLEEQAKFTPAQARLAAEVALRRGGLPRAVALARQAVPADARDYRDRLWQAKVFVLAGQLEEAEAALRDLAEKSPTVPEVWVALVRRLAEDGKRQQAVALLPQLAEKVPAYRAKLTLARAYEALGEIKQAEAAFQHSVGQQPDSFMGWKYLAEFYLRQQKFQQAEPWLRKILEPDHRVPSQFADVARRQLAISLARDGAAGKYAEALKLLKAHAGATPKAAADRIALAQVWATRPAQRDAAIRFLEDLRAQGPLPADAALALANLYRQANQAERAAAVLKELLAGEGDEPDWLAAYIDCLLEQREFIEAQVYLERLQQICPAHPQLPTLRQRAAPVIR